MTFFGTLKTMPPKRTQIDPDPDEKILILGELNVGKTSLINRLMQNEFSVDDGRSTFPVHKMTVDGRTLRLALWDPSGAECSRSFAQMSYRGASGALIVFDVSDASSFETAQLWIDEFKTNVKVSKIVSPNMQVILVGNKIDLTERAVDPDRISVLSQRAGAPYFETSAKTGEGVKEAFEALVRSIVAFKENNNSKADKCLIN